MVQQASDVRGAIDQVNRRFAEAFTRGDAAAAAAVYTENATILPPGSPRISGRDAIRAFWQAAMDSGAQAVSLQTDDLVVGDDMAREIGTATITIGPADGEAQTVSEKFVVVWKREGGEWRWETDIWNSDE